MFVSESFFFVWVVNFFVNVRYVLIFFRFVGIQQNIVCIGYSSQYIFYIGQLGIIWGIVEGVQYWISFGYFGSQFKIISFLCSFVIIYYSYVFMAIYIEYLYEVDGIYVVFGIIDNQEVICIDIIVVQECSYFFR